MQNPLSEIIVPELTKGKVHGAWKATLNWFKSNHNQDSENWLKKKSKLIEKEEACRKKDYTKTFYLIPQGVQTKPPEQEEKVRS